MTRPLFPEITVNGTVLSAAEIAAEAQNHPAPAGSKYGRRQRKLESAAAVSWIHGSNVINIMPIRS